MTESEVVKLKVWLAMGLQDELCQSQCEEALGWLGEDTPPRAFHVIAAISWQENDGCAGASPELRRIIDRLIAI